ncbi:MAG: ATP-dependent Clp protease adaptor ClpS [Spirochaetaceae bacterium]|jgi:ATP-dependent Clp protease adaptor protein ClpS|nr:ATP-dependent Clp protease adaptor ClpS [Spirochaetaceae bacterium]
MIYDFEESLAVEGEFQEPEQYRIILFNDDYTTKDFVVAVLTTIFHKSSEDAVILMEEVHRKGQAVVGVYIYDIAATRVEQVRAIARSNEFPLRCELEKV